MEGKRRRCRFDLKFCFRSVRGYRDEIDGRLDGSIPISGTPPRRGGGALAFQSPWRQIPAPLAPHKLRAPHVDRASKDPNFRSRPSIRRALERAREIFGGGHRSRAPCSRSSGQNRRAVAAAAGREAPRAGEEVGGAQPDHGVRRANQREERRGRPRSGVEENQGQAADKRRAGAGSHPGPTTAPGNGRERGKHARGRPTDTTPPPLSSSGTSPRARRPSCVKCGLGVRGARAELNYRQKLNAQLESLYGATFAEGSWWYANPTRRA